jgi:hypothetical protein
MNRRHARSLRGGRGERATTMQGAGSGDGGEKEWDGAGGQEDVGEGCRGEAQKKRQIRDGAWVAMLGEEEGGETKRTKARKAKNGIAEKK